MANAVEVFGSGRGRRREGGERAECRSRCDGLVGRGGVLGVLAREIANRSWREDSGDAGKIPKEASVSGSRASGRRRGSEDLLVASEIDKYFLASKVTVLVAFVDEVDKRVESTHDLWRKRARMRKEGSPCSPSLALVLFTHTLPILTTPPKSNESTYGTGR